MWVHCKNLLVLVLNFYVSYGILKLSNFYTNELKMGIKKIYNLIDNILKTGYRERVDFFGIPKYGV